MVGQSESQTAACRDQETAKFAYAHAACRKHRRNTAVLRMKTGLGSLAPRALGGSMETLFKLG